MKSMLTMWVVLLCGTIVSGQQHMELLSRVNYQAGVNDVWGYVAPDGTEYALVGLNTGVSIVSLADPTAAEELHFVSGANSNWRDLKTYGDYAYIVNETGQGLMVIDLSALPGSVSHSNYVVPMPGGGSINRCHNLYIDSLGRIYLVGCDANDGGVVVLDAEADAERPPVIAQGPGIYAHDVFVRGDYMFASEIYRGELAIYDISDLDNMVLTVRGSTPFNFTHNAWTTPDNDYVFTTDERANAYVAAYDISDKTAMVETDRHRPLATEGRGVIPHNVHVTDERFLVTSHYTDGVIVVDANRPGNLVQVGSYDTFGGPDGGFSGCWGAYPFLPSGVVLASDRQNGLHVLGVDYRRACYLEGRVTDYVTGQPVFDADVEILGGDLNRASTDLDGLYATGQVTEGSYEVRYSAAGYVPATLPVELVAGEVVVRDVRLVPLAAVVDLSGHVRAVYDSAAVAGAHVMWSNGDFVHGAFSDVDGRYVTGGVVWAPYGGWAAAWSFRERALDTVVVSGAADWPTVYMEKGYEDGFVLDQGWRVSGAPGRGAWVRAEPVGQRSAGVLTAPETDLPDDSGDLCYVTGNGAASAEKDGVTGGSTRLESPPIDLSLYNEAEIVWHEWRYFEDAPEALWRFGVRQKGTDFELGLVNTGSAGWEENSLAADQIFELPGFDRDSSFQIFFTIQNPDTTGIAEGGIDGFRIRDTRFARIFSVDSTTVCAGSELRFYDNNAHTVAWEWTFSYDTVEINSSERSPVIQFELPGSYDARLVAYSCFGDTLEFSLPGFVEVYGPPAADFEFLPPSPTGAVVTFFNESEYATSYEWHFGDGSVDFGRDPVHEYEEDGVYEVTLIVKSICGADTITYDLEVVTPPVAGFEADTSLLCIGGNLQFFDMSSSNVTEWLWHFEGGFPEMSTDTNPVVRYAVAGTYGAQLIVTGKGGRDTFRLDDVVLVMDVPTADFGYQAMARVVEFENMSSNATSYLWEFGDGAVSTEASPVHEYENNGSYVVVLHAENECGVVRDSVEITVVNTGGEALLRSDLELSPNPFGAYLQLRWHAAVPVRVELYDLWGRRVLERHADAGAAEMRLEPGLGAGVYLLVLRDPDGRVMSTRRVVRQ